MNISEVYTPSINTTKLSCQKISHLTGTIVYFAFDTGSTPPDGWLFCDGSAISRTTYSDLFAKIGTVFGSGDGSTTFNIPDTRGRFLRCSPLGSSRDPDSNRAVGSTQGFCVKQLSGNTDNWQRNYNNRGFGGGQQGSMYNVHYNASTDGGSGTDTCGDFRMDSIRQANSGSEFRPKNHALVCCIKY